MPTGHSALAPSWRSQRRFSANQRPVQCNCLVPGRFAARAQPRPKYVHCMLASIPGGRRTCSLVPPALPRDSIRAPPAEVRLVELQPRGPRERKPGPSSGVPHSQCPPPCSRELCTTVSESGCAGSETKIGRACVGKGAWPACRSQAICWRQESVALLLVIQFQSFSVTFTLRTRSPFLSGLLLPCPQG